MKKKIIIIAIILLVLVLILYFLFFFKRVDKNIIKAYGNIEIRQVDLSFQVSGIINEVLVEEGDYVKKGEILATLDDRDYKAKYNQALYLEQSSYAQAREDESKYKRNSKQNEA